MSAFLIGRDPSGKDIPVRTNSSGQLLVDIGNAALEVTADNVEIKNDIGNPIPVNGTVSAGGFQVVVSASFTRPSDTIAYAAQDVVSNSTTAPAVITFAAAARVNGGSGLIVSARHLKNSTNTVGANFRLQLYRVAPTAVNDNAQFPILFANRANRIGFIDFAHSTGGTGSDASAALATFVNLPFVCNAASNSLLGILTTTAAYTPTSGEQHFIELAIAQN